MRVPLEIKFLSSAIRQASKHVFTQRSNLYAGFPFLSIAHASYEFSKYFLA